MADQPSTEVLEEQDALVPTTDDSIPAPEAQAQEALEPTPEPEQPWFSRIPEDPDYHEIASLLETNQRFREKTAAALGRTAKKEYEAAIAERDARIAWYEQERAKAALAAMPEQQRTAYLLNNPQVAMQLQQRPMPPQEAQQQAYFEHTAAEILERGKAMGIPPERADQLANWAAQGNLDRDENGRELPRFEMLRRWEQVIQKDVAYWRQMAGQQRQTATAPRAPQAVQQTQTAVADPPKANPNLGGRGPDTSSRGTRVTTRDGQYRRSEVDSWDPEQILKTFGVGGYSRAVREGRIIDD